MLEKPKLEKEIYVVTYKNSDKKNVTEKFDSRIKAAIFARKVRSIVIKGDAPSGGKPEEKPAEKSAKPAKEK